VKDPRVWRKLSPPSWPVSVRVPIVVALLMVAISITVSNRVLSRLELTQERNLKQLASAYLDGLSASLIPSVVREDVWEVFDILDRSRERYRGLNVQWAVVTNSENRTIAASAPDKFPSLEVLPKEISAEFSSSEEAMTDEKGNQARMFRSLVYQDREIGRVYAVADISTLIQERSEVLRELILTNVLLTALLVAFGYFYMRRMLRPVGLLSTYLIRSREDTMTPIPDRVLHAQSREFRDLFARYNAMTEAVNEREVLAAELAEEEKLASVGRLASGMAHEINNPLGGMFNAIDSLKKYGAREEVRATSIRLLEHGLTGIRDLVRSTLTTYRTDQRPRNLTTTDLDDLRLLLKPEARQKKQRLNWRIEFDAPVHVPAVPVRDAIFNLLLNACHSSPENSSISMMASAREGEFVAEISDEGAGLPPHMKEYLERNGAGSAPLDRRSGLGLWIVKRHCDELKARLEVVRSGKGGTVIRFTVPIASGELEHAA
jgi:signal transduction histidine kinase